jgi:RNA polymerase sigma-70 factor, ECF subfamily
VTAGEDEGAVDRVLQGDTAAFGEIVRRWERPLINLAYRFCHDRGRAEDMAQEAFVRAFRALASWRRDGAFSTWLFAIATNVYRSELRRIPAEIPLEGIAEPVEERKTDSDLAERDERRLVRKALRTLPARYRDALVLFYFHEMDVAQAARSLDLPEGTVKAQLSRGRGMLREKLLRMQGGRGRTDGRD